MYKIYFNDKQILLSHECMRSWFQDNPEEELLLTYPGKTKFLLNYLDKLENDASLKRMIIFSSDIKQLEADFLSIVRIVPAAGGAVVNKNGEVLFIFRRGFWDLPKGKMEANESKKETAIREVEEETGLSGIKILEKLPSTYHVFKGVNGRRNLKLSYWYLMTPTESKVKVQKEEDIEDFRWVNPRNRAEIEALLPIYPNIVDIVSELIRRVDLPVSSQ